MFFEPLKHFWHWTCNSVLETITFRGEECMEERRNQIEWDRFKRAAMFYLWCYVTYWFAHPWPPCNLFLRIDFCVCLLPFLFVICHSQRLLHGGLTHLLPQQQEVLCSPCLSEKILFYTLFTHSISFLCFVGLWLWEEETAGNQRLVLLNV